MLARRTEIHSLSPEELAHEGYILMKLYWVTTEDHDEDWFVVAESSREAARFFEDFEGYDPGDAVAEAVLDIPGDVRAEMGWPPDELLEALGASALTSDGTRVVEIGGRRFAEGLLEETLRSLDDDLFEASGKDRINRTDKPPIH